MVKEDIKVLSFVVEEAMVTLKPNRPKKSSNNLLPQDSLSSLEWVNSHLFSYALLFFHFSQQKNDPKK